MKKRILFVLSSAFFITVYPQVGINTTDPTTTFHVVSTSTGSSTAEGIIAPNLTREQLISKDLKYTTAQKGAIVYVTDLSGTLTDKTTQITNVGYYYYDGSEWTPFRSEVKGPWLVQGGTVPTESNVENIYQTGSVSVGSSAVIANGYKFQVEGNEYINGRSKIGGASTATNASAQLELGDKDKGFLPNRVALVSLTSKEPVTNAEAGMFVYNTATLKAENLYPGLYLWDGTSWNLYYNSKNLNASNGITLDAYDESLGYNPIELGGTLSKKTTLKVPTSTNFEVKSAESTGGNLIVTDKGSVGINVASPSGVLNTNGSVYLQNLDQPIRQNLGINPFLTVNTTNPENLGRIEILDSSLSGLAGGFRPGKKNVKKTIQTVDTRNAIVNINFVFFVDNSSMEFDRMKEYYVYGSFTIICALGECRIVDVSLKDYYGLDFTNKAAGNNLKLTSTVTDTKISWSYPGMTTTLDQGPQIIELNPASGELSVTPGADNFSYLFSFFGGIK